MVLIKTEGAPAPAANENIDGTDWDRCPVHGTEAEPVHKIGHGFSRGQEYLDGVVYNSDLRTGGCGDTWGRKTSTGVEHDHGHSADSGVVTRTLGARRTILPSPVSEAYRDNYERIFGHG